MWRNSNSSLFVTFVRNDPHATRSTVGWRLIIFPYGMRHPAGNIALPEGEPFITKYNCVFSTGGPFSRQPCQADLGTARLGQRVIDRGPASRASRPRPRPVARAARSRSRKNRVSSAGRPSRSAVPCRRRETRSATGILEKKVQSIPYIYPMNSDLLYDSSRNTPRTCENHTHPCAVSYTHLTLPTICSV